MKSQNLILNRKRATQLKVLTWMVFGWVMLCVWGTTAQAQEAPVHATVNRNRITLTQPVELRITVQGADDVPAPSLPPLTAFESQYIGPQTQITIINGRYSRSITHVYRLFPKQTGVYEIPPISVTVDGKVHHTQPITITVTDGQAQQGEPVRLSDKIFLKISMDPPHPYQNQTVDVTAKLYVSSNLEIQNVGLKRFDHDGFLGEALTFVGRGREIINGRSYDVYHYHAKMTPVRAGSLTLGPCVLRVEVISPSEAEEEWDSLFEDDLFSAFFRKIDVRPLDVAASPVTVVVKEWPQQNQPATFSGAVGRFTISGTITPDETAVGEPVTVRIRIAGDGNLDAARLPSYRDLKGFKVYDPQISTDGDGAKIIEQILIPTDESLKEVPALSFVYFDPKQETYETIQAGPFPLKVKPGQTATTSRQPVASFFQESGSQNQASALSGDDIVYIKTQPGPWVPLESNPWAMWRFCLIGIGIQICAALGGFFWVRRHNDVVRRRRKAYLKDLKRIVREQKKKRQADAISPSFYLDLEPVLRSLLSDLLECPSSSLSADKIVERAALFKSPDGFVRDLSELWERCESVRYGRTAVAACDLVKDLQTTEELIRCVRRMI